MNIVIFMQYSSNLIIFVLNLEYRDSKDLNEMLH